MTRRDFLIGLGISPMLVSHRVVAMDNESLVHELMGLSPGKLTGNGYLLRKEAATAFESMVKAAKQDGISLKPVSSYRSFDQQAAIWNRKYTKYESQGYSGLEIIKRITEYSSLPGTSRHHWGTELDLVDGAKKIPTDPLHEKHFIGTGIYASMKKWLDKHAVEFGFVEAYTSNEGRGGFNYEPWHFSYQPLSIGYLSVYLGIEYKTISPHFKGLKGQELLTEKFLKDYIQTYLLGINPTLKPN